MEYFFIVTGLYIPTNVSSSKSYFIRRLQKEYPHFAISILLLAAVQNLSRDLPSIILNLLGLQLIRVDKYINGPLWFVVAEIPTLVLYRLIILRKQRSDNTLLFNAELMICLLISVVTIGIVGGCKNSFDLIDFKWLNLAFPAYIRAFCYITIGVAIRCFITKDKYKQSVSKVYRLPIWLRKMIIMILTVVCIVLQYCYAHTRVEFICMFLLLLGIMMSETIDWGKGELVKILTKMAYYTYPIYAYQMVAIEQTKNWMKSISIVNVFVLLLLAIALGVGTDYIICFFTKSNNIGEGTTYENIGT